MRSVLFWFVDGAKEPRAFDLDELSGRHHKDDAWVTIGGEGSTVDLPGSGLNRDQLHFAWDRRRAIWRLSNRGGSGSVVLLDGRRSIREGEAGMPLAHESGSCWISAGLETEAKRVEFRLRWTPEAPRYRGKAARSVEIPPGGLRIGRGVASDDPGVLALDSEIYSISSNQAAITRNGGGEWVLTCSPKGAKLRVNGSVDYDEHPLVFGDCLQMDGYDHYTFQFDGRSLVHVADGGEIQARGLEKVVKDGRRILAGIDLDLRCGEFVGVLGGSGQGKSTLMNAVCAISPATAGEVWLDGRKLETASDIADEAIGYVPQDDIVHRELTVREALEFGGRLRLNLGDRQLARAIDRVLESLGLEPHQHKRIRVLSGGQRKRVSIASELLANPRFLFLDEPTSGLDPQTEWDLMRELHGLRINRRMGIFCTTHVMQKSHVFDSVVFVHGGRIIFKGRPVDAARYFMLDRPFDGGRAEAPLSGIDESTGGTDRSTSGWTEISRDSSAETDIDLNEKFPRVFGKIEEAARKLGRHRSDGTVPTADEVAQEMERVYKESSYWKRPEPLETKGDMSKRQRRRGTQRPGFSETLRVLLARQWRILTSDPLNVVFLLAQALVIGLLVGWVSENLVFQMFIAVIATLWFGCSNAAQQIVGELPIFRRERLAGVGLNAYLAGKMWFLTAITSVQAAILFFAVLTSHHLFHPEILPLHPEPDRERSRIAFTEIFFSNRPEFMIPGVEPPMPSATPDPDTLAGFEVVFQDGMDKGQATPAARFENPTGLRAYDPQFAVLESVAWFFRIRENLIDELGVHKVESVGDSEPEPNRAWWAFTAILLGIRLGALLAAAVMGVALGLGVSALVQTPTQAVMWVPLILIPQILFGGFVVTSPEMASPVRRFAEALPSFNLQRLQDVANIYGRKAPRMTNKTKIPAFFAAPPYEEETVRWTNRTGTHQEKYDKISEVSKSWQNLAVLPSVIGQRFKERDEDSVSFRRDVVFPKGVGFRFSGGAVNSCTALLTWMAFLYLITLMGLRARQAQ